MKNKLLKLNGVFKNIPGKGKGESFEAKKIGLVIICTVISYVVKKLKLELMMKLQHGSHSAGKKMYTAH
jgi:hypothetical protein